MSNDLVTVATFNNPAEAAMARNYLEAGGVRAYLLDEETVAMDWGLANAIGGVKLKVTAVQQERAEFLLSELPGVDADDDGDLPPTAIATAETAEELRAEKEDETPKNLAVDRLFRIAVFGWLLWPLQAYALWVLLTLRSMPGTVSPNRRWKVWASALLNAPLMSAIIIPLALLSGMLRGSLANTPSWTRMEFPNEGFSALFPHAPEPSNGHWATGFGQASHDSYSAAADDIVYRVSVIRYPNAAHGAAPEKLLADETAALIHGWQATVVWQKQIDLHGKPGVDCALEMPALPGRVFGKAKDRFARMRFFYTPDHLYVVEASRPKERSVSPPEVRRFLDSFALR